jgi:peptide/nickel transport system permease protein
MAQFIFKRILNLIPLLILISIISFVIIQLPPGDYVSSYIARLAEMGDQVSDEQIANLRARYGLDQPVIVQYFRWITRVLTGDFGYSFEYKEPVGEIIWSRLGFTLLITLTSTIFVWIVAFLVGFYSATHQYSLGDYIATFFGFIGLATPNFMLALIIMWLAYDWFGISIGGLFSREFIDAPWSLARVGDLLAHIWIPIVVVGTAGTASLIRIFRANLLDELSKPYVETAKAKGIPERRLILKYPVRIALIPFIATVGWTLPRLVSSATITAVVLSLPTTGPVLLQALRSQDMYLAGSFILLLSTLTVIGTLVSDILLAWVDPRITYED